MLRWLEDAENDLRGLEVTIWRIKRNYRSERISGGKNAWFLRGPYEIQGVNKYIY
jgi:hypothetical protein